ncbi:3-hydroxyisobutyryl-CoA hydrolase [Corynebacterium capitovis DSM 44611]|uniref:enoyl-CoA hydratase/isomerase family protein n=1 Tax=Corynebacterium capitovis TaxID=131081 RepID=UPI00035C5C36|nr:3-hydroxyisobutyryl-CoA hydrolase [Corynebacterium capitovis DSM 44611]
MRWRRPGRSFAARGVTQATNTSVVVGEIRGKAGIIALNRPEGLNALNLDTVCDMRRVFEAWADEETVRLVILRGAG